MHLTESILSLEIGLIYGIVAVGIYLTFRVIDFPDLTCDGSFVLGAALSAVMIKAGISPLLALGCAFLAGHLAGLLTGVLHTHFKITNLLSGILIAFMLYSINLKIMGGIPNIALIDDLTIFTDRNHVVLITVIAFIIAAACSYLLKTDFGLSLRSIAHNKRLAMNAGVRIDRMTIITLALSNGLISLGGALFSQHQGFCDISQGIGTVIIGLAAVMIGEKILPSRSVIIAIFSCLAGSIIYRLFIAVALHSDWLGLSTQDLNLVTGLMIIGVMLIPGIKRKHA
jgi:putative ABC transport system permease protein